MNNRQLKEMDKETFQHIYTDDKLRHAVAFAHGCLDENGKHKHYLALYYPIDYKVTLEQIKEAKKYHDQRAKEILKANKNKLLFIGMGCDFEPDKVGYVGNHRITTHFLNADGKRCFLGLGSTPNKNFMRVDHAVFYYGEEKQKRNYNDLERTRSHTKYTYENILKIVNENFNCNFKEVVVDSYTVRCDGLTCESPKNEVQ